MAQRARVERLKECREELSQALIDATSERNEQATLLAGAKAEAAELRTLLEAAERELQAARSLRSCAVQTARHWPTPALIGMLQGRSATATVMS